LARRDQWQLVAAIAVFTKERVTECIANQDGERQVAFIGQEVVRVPRYYYVQPCADGAMPSLADSIEIKQRGIWLKTLGFHEHRMLTCHLG
jgi:hypothetical protein